MARSRRAQNALRSRWHLTGWSLGILCVKGSELATPHEACGAVLKLLSFSVDSVSRDLDLYICTNLPDQVLALEALVLWATSKFGHGLARRRDVLRRSCACFGLGVDRFTNLQI